MVIVLYDTHVKQCVIYMTNARIKIFFINTRIHNNVQTTLLFDLLISIELLSLGI